MSAGGGCRPMRCKSGENLDDRAAALVERLPKRSLLFIERLEPRPRRVDIGLDVADLRRRVDELLIEFAAVLA